MKSAKWEAVDNTRAAAEGWALIESGARGWEVQRDDEAGLLMDDRAAVELVAKRARQGSRFHRRALLILEWRRKRAELREIARR